MFHGVRVVELASILAMPSPARIMANLGADVVKVECPGGAGSGGDPLRTVTLPYEEPHRQKRGVGTKFECLHPGKKSLCIDVELERKKLITLLRSADVFVTNSRQFHLYWCSHSLSARGAIPARTFSFISILLARNVCALRVGHCPRP